MEGVSDIDSRAVPSVLPTKQHQFQLSSSVPPAIFLSIHRLSHLGEVYYIEIILSECQY